MGTMSDLLQHLARDIECATRRIWIATYIFADGRLGRRFARSFARAAARGVDVRVLYDAFGSAMTPRAFWEALEARGVSTRAYRPLWSVIRAGSVFPREHSRIVVVDDAGYVGGAGLSDEWLPETQGGEGWREVCLRVEGPCVRSMGRAFLHRWSRAEEPEAAWFSAQTRGYRDVELVHASCGEDVLLERYVERARSARRRIWVTNAYFCPPRELERELLAAAARGVDVRVLVPRRSDLPALQGAAFARYGRWLDGGTPGPAGPAAAERPSADRPPASSSSARARAPRGAAASAAARWRGIFARRLAPARGPTRSRSRSRRGCPW